MLTALLNNNLLKLLNTSKGELETIEFSPEVVKDSKIINIEEFSTKLKEKINTKKWGGKKVAVGLNEENTFQADAVVEKDSKDYLAKVNEAVTKNIPHKPEDLYITTKIVSEDNGFQRVQIAAVEKSFLDGFSKALVEAGLKVDYFVPVSLGLASLGGDKEKPQLLVSRDEKEVFYVFVSEDGLVQFSATYPAADVLKSTEEVVKYLSEKYPEHPVRKTLVYGFKAAETAKSLKQNGLVVEELTLKSKQYPFMELISKFSDAKLIFMPPQQEKAKKDNKGSLFGFLSDKKEDVQEKGETVEDSDSAQSFEAQRMQDNLEGAPSETKEIPESKKAAFLKSTSDSGKKYLLLGLGVFAVLSALAVVLLVVKPWEKGEDVEVGSLAPAEETPPPATQEKPSMGATPSAEVVKEFNREDYSVQVLNGRGTAGLAGATRDTLLELGYGDVVVDNADERDMSIVRYSKGNKALAETLMKDLAGQFEFTEPEPIDSSSSFDAVIIIGDK